MTTGSAFSAPTAPRTRPWAGAAGRDEPMQFDPILQWGVAKCGFPDMWTTLDREGTDPGPIGMIDNGCHRKHRELLDRVPKYTGPPKDSASIADHASSVAAIMSARHGEPVPAGGQDMYGCCSAKIWLYNVWTRNGGIDNKAIVAALDDAATNKLPVVNISVTSEKNEPEIAAAIQRCIDAGVVIVAAMGNFGLKGPDKLYPAADPNVIAVAATDAEDQRWYDSSVGTHVHIAAPGQRIWSIMGNTDYDYVDGTSFAAPFVSAAVWLAKRRRPNLSVQQVRDLLRVSVKEPGCPRDDRLGYGRLDMNNLVKALDAIP